MHRTRDTTMQAQYGNGSQRAFRFASVGLNFDFTANEISPRSRKMGHTNLRVWNIIDPTRAVGPLDVVPVREISLDYRWCRVDGYIQFVQLWSHV